MGQFLANIAVHNLGTALNSCFPSDYIEDKDEGKNIISVQFISFEIRTILKPYISCLLVCEYGFLLYSKCLKFGRPKSRLIEVQISATFNL